MIENKIYTLIEQIEQLMNDSSVEVICFDYSSGTTNAELDHIETNYQLKLSNEIKDFYLNINGFKLLWIDKNNPDYNPSQHFYQKDFDLERYIKKEEPFDGCINIWPIGDVFSHNWDESITFFEEKEENITLLNKTYNLYDVKKRFTPFDVFSKTDCVGFYNTLETNEVNKIIYASDYYISFRNSKSISMAQYFDLLIETNGRIDGRNKPFNGGIGSFNF